MHLPAISLEPRRLARSSPKRLAPINRVSPLDSLMPTVFCGSLIFGIRQNEVKAKGTRTSTHRKLMDNALQRKATFSGSGATLPIQMDKLLQFFLESRGSLSLAATFFESY
jgi:hypothetical protein